MYPWQPPASFFPYLESIKDNSPSTPVASTSKESASGHEAKEKRAERRKLPEEAINVLRDYCNNMTIEPTPSQRRELLTLIRSIPGAEWYTSNHMYGYFVSRRQAAKKRGEDTARNEQSDAVGDRRSRAYRKRVVETKAMTSANILWPSLDTVKLAKLTVLHRENPNPNDAVLEVWARALKAEKDDVHNWVQMNSLGSSPEKAVKSLPSPDSIGTPEPVKQEPPSKTSLYSPTESHAMLLGSPEERKPSLPLTSSIASLVSTAAVETPRATSASRSPEQVTRLKMLSPLSIPQVTNSAVLSPSISRAPFRHFVHDKSDSRILNMSPHSLEPSPSCSPQTAIRNLPIAQLPTPIEPPARPLVIRSTLTPETYAQAHPPSQCTSIPHSTPADLIPLPKPATRSPLIPQSPPIKNVRTISSLEHATGSPSSVIHQDKLSQTPATPPSTISDTSVEPLTFVDASANSSPCALPEAQPQSPASKDAHSIDGEHHSTSSCEHVPTSTPSETKTLVENTAEQANPPIADVPMGNPDIPMELDSSSPARGEPQHELPPPANHDSPPALAHPLSPSSSDSADESMDLETPPSSPAEYELPSQFTAAKVEPKRSRLAELAMFVDERLSLSGSSVSAATSKMSLDEFDESLRASQVFFEKIKSGVYSEQGLVLRDYDA